MSAVTAAVGRRWHRHRYLNLAQTYTYKLFFAHLGKFQVIAIYYVLTQWLHGQRFGNTSWHLPDVKGTWDHALSASVANGGVVHLMDTAQWNSMRHVVFRGLIEGVLGVVLFNQIGFNVEKYKKKIDKKKAAGKGKTLHWYNKVFASPYQTFPVTPLQYVFLPVLLVLVTICLGVPLYLGFHAGLDHALHWTWLEPSLGQKQSFVQKLYVGDYDGVVIGIIVGFVAERTYRAYLFANTMNYSRTWVIKGRGPRWWMPQQTRTLVAELKAQGVEASQRVLAKQHPAVAFVVGLGLVIGAALAAYGFYIVKFIA